MEQANYWIALLTIITFPAGIVFWLIVHPLTSLWRKLGPTTTYIITLVMLIGVGTLIAWFREPLLRIRFAWNPWLAALGVICFAASIYLGILRKRALPVSTMAGVPQLSGETSAETLITTGIYARIRHPRYVEGGLGLAAMALWCNYLAVYILLVLYLPAITLVAILEERELLTRFGNEYERYCREVPRFIPRSRHRAT